MSEDSELLRGASGTQNQVLLAEPMVIQTCSVTSSSLYVFNLFPGVSLVSSLDFSQLGVYSSNMSHSKLSPFLVNLYFIISRWALTK